MLLWGECSVVTVVEVGVVCVCMYLLENIENDLMKKRKANKTLP